MGGHRAVPHPLPKVTPTGPAGRPRRRAARRGHERGRAALHPRRGRLGQDPGAHPPHRLPARDGLGRSRATSSPSPSPARPPASCAPRLGALGVRDQVAAGTFHAVAYAQLRQRWADSGVSAPALLDRKVRLLAAAARSADAARGPARAARRGRRRDRVGQGPADRPRRATRPRRPRPAARPPLPPATMAVDLRALRGARSARRGWSTSTTCSSLCAAALERRRRLRRRAALAVPPPLRRRVPGRQPAAVPRCSRRWLGDRTDLCVVGDPNQAIYAWNGADAGVPRRASRDRSPASTVVRLDDNYRSTPADRSRGVIGVLARARSPHGAGPTGRSRRSPSHPTDAPRRAARGAARPRPARAHVGGATSPCSPAPTRSSRRSRRRCAAAACRAACGGGGCLLEQPEVQAWLRDPRHRGATPLAPRLADLEASARRRPTIEATGDDGDRAHRRAPAQPRRARAPRPRVPRPRPRRHLGRASSPGSSATLRPTTRRPTPTRSSSPRSTAQGARVAGGLRHRPRARARADRSRDDARGPRRGAAPALRRAHAGRARAAPHVGGATHVRHAPDEPFALPVAAHHRGRVRGDAPRAPPRPTTAPRCATRSARSKQPAPASATEQRPALPGTQGVATCPCPGSRDARVHDLRRQDAHRDRREQPRTKTALRACRASGR